MSAGNQKHAVCLGQLMSFLCEEIPVCADVLSIEQGRWGRVAY